MKGSLHPYLFAPLALLFYLLPGIAQAQSLQDTLEAVDIIAPKDTAADPRSSFTAGQQLQPIESRYKDLYRLQSVANLLAQQTSVFVKAYGINSMATLSFRGASAAQSSVLWNGVPVLNPALGVADVSLLGSGLFDHISIRYGSSAALYGSGNVGGVLLLDDVPADFTKTRNLKVLTGLGTYGKRDAALGAMLQSERWRINLQGFYQSAKNDFPYKDDDGTIKTMKHADMSAAGGIFSADYNLGHTASTDDHTLSFKLWMQQYDRKIPAALFEQRSEKEQTDASLRSLLGWQRKWGNRMLLFAKASFNRELLRYRDGIIVPDNTNIINQYYQEIGMKWRIDDPAASARFGRHTLLLLLPLQHAAVKSDSLDSAPVQFRPAVAMAYNFGTANGRIKAAVSLRQEWNNGSSLPLLPGAGASLRLVSMNNAAAEFSLMARVNVQKTYRLPTLNELYYFPGGNKELRPEQGWAQDAGYTLVWSGNSRKAGEPIRNSFRFTQDAAVFNRNIEDWIYWLGGAVWTPHNIARVRSRGLETDNKLEIPLNKAKLALSLRTAYVLSTTEASYLPDDKSKGKQIPYTPRYNAQMNIGIEAYGLFLNYNHTYTGYRFVTVDESQYLPPYSLGNMQIVYSLIINDYFIRTSLQVQNIWNKDYKVVWERPMPRRYVLCSLMFEL